MQPHAPENALLVAALLAVNEYPVDRAFALMPAFEERGLLDPKRVAAMPHPELIEAMNAAGYQRGGYVPILSFRLYALMEAITLGALAALPHLARTGKRDEFVAALTALPGFGPRTAATAWELFRAIGG